MEDARVTEEEHPAASSASSSTASPPPTNRVEFRVRVPHARPWEEVFVVGSHAELGEWQPTSARVLKRDTDEKNLWIGEFVFDSHELIRFRYFTGQFLSPASWLVLPADAADGEATSPNREPPSSSRQSHDDVLLLVSRWEAHLSPRSVHPSPTAPHSPVYHSFGEFDGRKSVADGWLQHPAECAVYLRLFGRSALKFYQTWKWASRPHRVKCVPFDIRFRENESLDESSLDPPPFPSFTQTEVASLLTSEPRFGEQQPHGVAYAKDDYVVFRTRTVSIKDLGFRFEIFAESESKWIRVGSAFTLPGKFAESTGTASVPILALNQMPIGEVNVEFLVVRALTEVEAAARDDMRATFAHYWRKRPTLEIGHRGMGCSYTKTAAARENTVHSLREAAKRGADYVEFDVQVTKDKKVLLFHDFQVVVHVANRELNGQIAKHEVAVKDLSLEQLKLLHFEHCHALKEAHERGIMSIVPSADEAVRLASGAKEANPFPLLSEALESIDQDVGFNIEIKYPQPFKDGTHECANFWERNVYVDFILDVVFEHGKERRILFSSFDADVCTMINQKQNRYPVLFLIEGPTKRYTHYIDKRTSQTRLSVNFALADRILGLNFHSEELMEDTSELERAVGLGLVCFAWGDDLNQPEVVERLKKTLLMDGLIYDRIGEEMKRSNVFVVEKETKSALFGVASPAPSRRASDDLQTAAVSRSGEDRVGWQVRSPPSRMLSVNQARSPRK